MALTGSRSRAVAWAQWRTLVNRVRHGRSGWLTGAAAVVWYAFWALGGWSLAAVAADPETLPDLRRFLPAGLFAVTLLWQLIPVLMLQAGSSLDLSRLVTYPVSSAEIFRMDVLLRLTGAGEMLLILGGLGIGLSLNPAVPWVSPASLVLLAAFNVFLAAGLRNAFVRLLARRGVREVLVLVLVLVAAAPQALLINAEGDDRAWLESGFGLWWPWSAAARVATGGPEIASVLLLAGAIVAAAVFARDQLERTLRFDSAALSGRRGGRLGGAFTQAAMRTPRKLLSDPLAALISRQLLTLGRSPRFQLLFLMGFSFGLLIWMPVVMGAGEEYGIGGNFLAVVCTYGVLLLGEPLAWNSLGMDRGAIQLYFSAPVRFSTVLVANNLAAGCWLAAEVAAIVAVSALFRLPVTAAAVAEAAGAAAVTGLCMLSLGNVFSVRFPRPSDPEQSFGSGAGRSGQAMLIGLSLLAVTPALLAHGARFAFDSTAAYWAVIGVDLLLGAGFYPVALESAVRTAVQRRESIVASLSRSTAPLGG